MTARSKTGLGTQITTLLPDNIISSIDPAEHRTVEQDIVDTMLGVFGELYVTGGAVAQSLTTTPAKLTGWAANGNSDNTTPDHTDDSITCPIAGTYLVTAHLFGSGADTYTFEVRVDAVAVPGLLTKVTPGAGGQAAVIVGIVTVTATQKIMIYGSSNQGGGSNYTPVEAQLAIKLIG